MLWGLVLAFLASCAFGDVAVDARGSVSATQHTTVSLLLPVLDGNTKLTLLAIESAKIQTNLPSGALELVIVDGGLDAVLKASQVAALPRWVRYFRLPPPLPDTWTIGSLYAEAVTRSSGDILLHWDAEVWHSTLQVSQQIAALTAGTADATVIEPQLLLLVSHSPQRAGFLDVQSCQNDCGVLPSANVGSSLAYTRSFAERSACFYPQHGVHASDFLVTCLYHAGGRVASVDPRLSARLTRSLLCGDVDQLRVPAVKPFNASWLVPYASVLFALPTWPAGADDTHISLPQQHRLSVPTTQVSLRTADADVLLAPQYWPAYSRSGADGALIAYGRRLAHSSAEATPQWSRRLPDVTPDVSCASGQYYSSLTFSCMKCTACVPGERLMAACTATSDAQCRGAFTVAALAPCGYSDGGTLSMI